MGEWQRNSRSRSAAARGQGAGAVARVLASGTRFLIPLHLAPDGDSVGSCLALGNVLTGLGKEVTLTYERDPAPTRYGFLPGFELLVPVSEARGRYSAFVFLDMTEPSRAGERTGALAIEAVRGEGSAGEGAGGEKTVTVDAIVNVDHHPTNAGFGDVTYVDACAPAVGEMLIYVFRCMGVDPGPEAATCLYTALATDTGSFSYQNATPRAFRAAALLVSRGASPELVSREVYESRSVGTLRLLGLALGTLEIEARGKIAHMTVTREMLSRAGAVLEDTEGLINYPRSLNGVEIAILFREEDDGRIKVGFRSRRASVATLAKSLGGGGHAAAAGCLLDGPLAAAKRTVLEATYRVVGLSEATAW